MAEPYFCPMCGERHGDSVAEGLAEPENVSRETFDVGDPEDEEVAVAAIEAVAEVAEAALATVVELHAQEEETERLEVIEDAETDRTEVIAEALADIAEEEPEDKPALDEEPEEDEEPEGAEETGEPIAVAPPPREEAAQGGKVPVRQESAFSRRHRH